jgi:hypothetical protein
MTRECAPPVTYASFAFRSNCQLAGSERECNERRVQGCTDKNWEPNAKPSCSEPPHRTRLVSAKLIPVATRKPKVWPSVAAPARAPCVSEMAIYEALLERAT